MFSSLFRLGKNDHHDAHDHHHSEHDEHDHASDDHSHWHSVPVRTHASQSDHDIGQVALEIGDTEEEIVIIAPIAGVASDEIDIAIAKNILTISGVRRRPESGEKFRKILVEECFWGPFSRSVILPENLAVDKISARMENNLLEVTIPRIRFPSRSVRINA